MRRSVSSDTQRPIPPPGYPGIPRASRYYYGQRTSPGGMPLVEPHWIWREEVLGGGESGGDVATGNLGTV